MNDDDGEINLGIQSGPPAKARAVEDESKELLKVAREIRGHLAWIFWFVFLASSIYMVRSCASFVAVMERENARSAPTAPPSFP